MIENKKIGKIFVIGFLISLGVCVLFHLIVSLVFLKFDYKDFFGDLLIFCFAYIVFNLMMYFCHVGEHGEGVYSWCLLAIVFLVPCLIVFVVKVWNEPYFIHPFSGVLAVVVSCGQWIYVENKNGDGWKGWRSGRS